MSELITSQSRSDMRLQLLATVSTLVLLTVVAAPAKAEDATRPTVWIEGGYHLDSVSGTNTPFVPPIDALTTANGFPSLTEIENALGRSYGAEGSISFQPKGSDWIVSVSARYGRTHSARNIHLENKIVGPQMKKTVQQGSIFVNVPYTPSFTNYVDQTAGNSEAHTIVDFQIGRDVGVGLLGHSTETVISFGARYAQLNARSKVGARALPDADFEQGTKPGYFLHTKYNVNIYNHGSAALADRNNDLRAMGPSLSMSNATTILGNTADGELAIDWGVNAAVLFGRQRTNVHHQSTQQLLQNNYRSNVVGVQTIVATPVHSTRSRSVTVPNLGGFAALSWRFTNAKISAGYRADFFFGAMDRGLDAPQSVTTGFHGPFVTLSAGLGG